MINDPKHPEYNAKQRDAIMDLAPFYDPNHKSGVVREGVFKDCLFEIRERERLALESARRLDALFVSWMPIETAPKDGTLIDLCCESVEEYRTCSIRLTDVAWHEASEIFPHTGWIRVTDDGNFDLVDGPPSCPMGLPQWTPTYWMPVPSLPNTTAHPPARVG